MAKKILSLLLAVLLCLTLVPAALATEGPAEDAAASEPVEAPAEEVEAPAEEVKAPAEEPEAPAEEIEAPAEEPVEEPAEDIEESAEEPVEAPAEEPEASAEETEAIPAAVSAAGGADALPIDEAHFPDDIFRASVSEDFDLDKDGYLSEEEIAEAQYIVFMDVGLASLKGIEYFPQLLYVYCNETDLTGLDISANPLVETIYCRNDKLTSLVIGENTALRSITCEGNLLTDLDISGAPALEELTCQNNRLTALDVSANPALKILRCDGNNLTELDVTACPALVELVEAGKQPSVLPGDTATSWFYEMGDTEEWLGGGMWFFPDDYSEYRLVRLLICDQAVTVTAGNTVIPGGSPSPAPLTPAQPLFVTIAGDGSSAAVTGDASGLYVRIALSVTFKDETGLIIQQGEIGPDGRIEIPALSLQGITVTGVSVALVRTLEDIQSPAPSFEAMDSVTLGSGSLLPGWLSGIVTYIRGLLGR